MNDDRALLCEILSGADASQVLHSLSAARWAPLLESALREGVLPLLRWRLPRRTESLPGPVLEKVVRSSLAAYTANRLLQEELSRILAAFGDFADSDVAVIKGAALAYTVYPDFALRPMSDIDLLLRPERIELALSRLESLGYRRLTPELGPGWDSSIVHAVGLRGGRFGKVLVDLHWNLVAGKYDRRAPEMDSIWHRMKRFQLPRRGSPSSGTAHCRRLDRHDELLYLAAHLILQHGKSEARLIWYYDLHLLFGDPDAIAWDELLERARDLGWSAALASALDGCRERFRTELPAGILERLRHQAESCETRIAETMMSLDRTKAGDLWNRARWLPLRTRTLLLARHVVPTPTYMKWRYQPRPSWLFPVFYPYRWGCILREAARAIDMKWRAR